MKLLLIYPYARSELIGWGDLGAIAEPLALEYLSAGAIADGHEVRLLDLRLHRDALDDTLTSYQPDVVGITGYSMHVLGALAVLAHCKELVPSSRTVVGGHHATLLPEDFFEPQVDFVVQGEGVRPLVALLRALDAKRSTAFIPGLWSRTGEGRGAFSCGGPPAPFDIDDLPPPDRSLAPADRSVYFIRLDETDRAHALDGRLSYRCSFCSLWKIMDGSYTCAVWIVWWPSCATSPRTASSSSTMRRSSTGAA